VAVFLGETAPENLTGEIRRFQPTHVVILDAADVGAAPGHIEVIPNDAPTQNPTISTHSLPMKVFTDFLTKSIGCQAVVAGIQPATREFGRPVSAAVKRAAARLAAALAAVLSE
jgi:hydrogenase 3 maturation protease